MLKTNKKHKKMNINKLFFTASIFFALVFQSVFVFAQSPQKVSYQMVVRNASGELVKESAVGVRMSILQGSAEGTAVYVETHAPQSNVNGLVSLEVGSGTPVENTFAGIDWASGPYFLKAETDPAGGSSYSISGISEILSVPYALHAKTVETETDPSVPTGTQTGEMQYWNGSEWVTVPTGNEGQVLTFTAGAPTWSTTVGLNDVQNPTTGEIWMDRNLGASQVATASDDADAYGDLYQWGRAADGHEKRTSVTTSTLSSSDTPGHGDFILAPNSPYDWRSPQSNDLWQGVNGTNNPCPAGYRLPTIAELDAERQSWSSNDAAGAFNSPLKLPVAGGRSSYDGSLLDMGSYGYYWSSTVDGSYSRDLTFYSSNAYTSNYRRALGLSVRCLKEN
jgi:uncharacterized protein (TIGR02145 family)